MTNTYRTERDSMGEVAVPTHSLYGAQTQRALDNFGLSDWTMPPTFISALGFIKAAAAMSNAELHLLDTDKAQAIRTAAIQVANNRHDRHFPVDVFQTGSGTSSNMNANEVIANLCVAEGVAVHPNDHVNMGQSSNDVVPTAIQLAAARAVAQQLVPALITLRTSIQTRMRELESTVKTGRTHLMDAMPVTMAQELSAWDSAVAANEQQLADGQIALSALPIGGTAVGTGINTPPEFAALCVQHLARLTAMPLTGADNLFLGLSMPSSLLALSGHLRNLAVTLMKISNDLRWMNSGPLAGLGEIELEALQPGSSIMPGKVNPVIPEAVAMASAHVMGSDATVGIAVQSGTFQLNVMLPLVAHHLLTCVPLLARACTRLATKAVATFRVNHEQLQGALARNPILVTALNRRIGYEKAATIAKLAYAQRRPIREVAAEHTDLTEDELATLLDPLQLTAGGNP